MEEGKNSEKKAHSKVLFESLNILMSRWVDGTFSEILDDWKWIFSYSARYKWAILIYTVLGLLSTTLGLVGSVVSKYLLDVITGYRTDQLGVLIAVMVGSTVLNLTFNSAFNRFNTKLSISIHNDIQADIFDQIADADWLALSRYPNGDVLNRFNRDVETVSSNAISWLPSIIIVLYNFAATFAVILYYDWFMAVLALSSAPILFLLSAAVQREALAHLPFPIIKNSQ